MSQVTLELVRERQTELAAMIDELQRRASVLQIPATNISLHSGEWYAGAVLNEDGSLKHHTVVAAVNDDELDFNDTQSWAQGLGLSAPTIQEARLIVAHKYGRLASMSSFWTCEPHENSAYAWHCDLSYGYVDYGNRSFERGAVAVRRVTPT